MHDCIFTAHCTEVSCDRSCPALVEVTYLMERNGLGMTNSVFSDPRVDVPKLERILNKFSGSQGTVIVPTRDTLTTVKWAEALTYCAICHNWRGSRLHCTVYNLRLSKYLDDLKQSWSATSPSDNLEYIRIWSESAKVLIISNFDYVNFGDFEAQTLLNLLQLRQSEDKTTILVSPPLSQLISGKSSMFFNLLKNRLQASAQEVTKC